MEIISVKREKKHLVTVTLETGYSFSVDLDVYNSYPLHSGENISPEKIKELSDISDYQRTKSRALYYLDNSSHTRKGLYDKLVKAGFPKETIIRVLNRFEELSLIDDFAFAKRYTQRCIEANISKREIHSKLMLKGVPVGIIKEVLEGTEVDEAAQIKAVIDKKYRTKLADRDNLQKVYGALIRKGFSYSGVKTALKDYLDELEFSD